MILCATTVAYAFFARREPQIVVKLVPITEKTRCQDLLDAQNWHISAQKRLEACNRLIAYFPTAEAHKQRGRALYDMERINDAIAEWDTAVRLDPMCDVKEWRKIAMEQVK